MSADLGALQRSYWALADHETPNSLVYFARNPDTGAVKIGRTSNLRARIATLRTAVPGIEVVGTFPGGATAEAEMHATFAADRIAGEWFRPSMDLARTILAVCTRLGPEAAR